MRVPRALEFPALITVTAVLTFTGVSGLQAADNFSHHHHGNADQAAAGSQHSHEAEFEGGLSAAEGRIILAYLLPAGPVDQEAAPPQSLALAGRQAEKSSGPVARATPDDIQNAASDVAGETTSSVPAAPASNAGPSVSAAPEQLSEPQIQARAQTQAQGQGQGERIQLPAQPATPAAAQVRPGHASITAAAAAAHAAVSQRKKPAPAVPSPLPAPIPASGMDYVWDQVVGSGKFPRPGKNTHAHGAGAVSGQAIGDADPTPAGKATQTCPPGQAKKDNC